VIQEIIIDSRPCKNPPVAIKKQMTVLINSPLLRRPTWLRSTNNGINSESVFIAIPFIYIITDTNWVLLCVYKLQEVLI